MNNKATKRFTTTDRFNNTIKADRRAAAAERRAERLAGVQTELQERARMYSNVGK